MWYLILFAMPNRRTRFATTATQSWTALRAIKLHIISLLTSVALGEKLTHASDSNCGGGALAVLTRTHGRKIAQMLKAVAMGPNVPPRTGKVNDANHQGLQPGGRKTQKSALFNARASRGLASNRCPHNHLHVLDQLSTGVPSWVL